MKYSSHLISFILIAIGVLAFPVIEAKKVLPLGCETLYRTGGNNTNCSDISTEYARNLWIEKYSICLEQHLSRAIASYNRKLPNYYAQWRKQEGLALTQDVKLEDVWSKHIDLSETKSRKYKGSVDFCQ